jgi:hypothetical protein
MRLRYLVLALDAAGVTLLIGGLTGLAYLAHPYLATAVAGALCVILAHVLSPDRGAGR